MWTSYRNIQLIVVACILHIVYYICLYKIVCNSFVVVVVICGAKAVQ